MKYLEVHNLIGLGCTTSIILSVIINYYFDVIVQYNYNLYNADSGRITKLPVKLHRFKSDIDYLW